MPGFVLVKTPSGKTKRMPEENVSKLPSGYSVVKAEGNPDRFAERHGLDAPEPSAPLVGAEPSSRRKNQPGHVEAPPERLSPAEQARANAETNRQKMAEAEGADANQLQAYRQARAQKPWFNIPGHGNGTEPPEDGDWWDQIKKAIPAKLRDVTLIPSHGPVWQDPTDEEAEQALTTWEKGKGFTKPTPLQIEQYKDSKWNEELRQAQKERRTTYRGSRINVKSPSFMKVAQALQQTFGKVEAYARGIDRSVTGGVVGAAVDMPAPDLLGTPEDLEKTKATARRNLTNSQRLMGDEAVFAGGGMLAGALIPAGVAGRTANAADKALKAGQHATSRGVIEGVARGTASAAAGTFASEVAAGEVENAARGAADMKTKPQSEIMQDAGTSALVAAPFGAALSLPGAVSRSIRVSGSPHQQALQELEDGGGGTHWLAGEQGPPGSLELAQTQKKQKGPSSVDVARDRAMKEMAPAVDDLERARAAAEAGVGAETHGMVDNFLLDAYRADEGIKQVAGDAIERGRVIDAAAENRTAQVADKVLGSLKRILPEQAVAGKLEKEAALRASESGAMSGLSMRPVVEKYQNIIKSMSWADGEAMPNTTVRKFKDAIGSITEKKVVAKEDLWLYGDAMVGEAKIVKGADGEELAEILLPREVGPRELDNFTRRMDEMANYEGGGGVDSTRFKGIAAEARKLGDEFKALRDSNTRSHNELLETEAMLQATGLNKAPADAANVTEATSVFNNLKGMLSDRKLDSDLALRRPVFEKWLAAKDPQLFSEYVELRKLKKQQAGVNAFNITADGDYGAASLSSLIETMKGNPVKFDAMTDSLGMGVAARAARQEYFRVNDIFEHLLGAKMNPNMGEAERFQLRGKMYDVFVKGGPEFDMLLNAQRPEVRVAMQPVIRAAKDSDKMFQSLGFAPGKWATAKREEITGGLFQLLDKFREKGAGDDFNKYVESLYRERPALKDAIELMRSERAFQHLARNAKDNASLVVTADGAKGYERGMLDFINHRLDALMGHGQKGRLPGFNKPGKMNFGVSEETASSPLLRSPVGAPTEYAMATSAATSREDETGKGGLFMVGRTGFDFLYNLGQVASKVFTRD